MTLAQGRQGVDCSIFEKIAYATMDEEAWDVLNCHAHEGRIKKKNPRIEYKKIWDLQFR